MLRKTNKYDKDLQIKIKSILDSIDKQNLKTSNGKENDINLENYVRALNKFIRNCKENLSLNLKDIRKIMSLNEKIEGDRIFIESQ